MDYKDFQDSYLYGLLSVPAKVAYAMYFLDPGKDGMTLEELCIGLRDQVSDDRVSAGLATLYHWGNIDVHYLQKGRLMRPAYTLNSACDESLDNLVCPFEPAKIDTCHSAETL